MFHSREWTTQHAQIALDTATNKRTTQTLTSPLKQSPDRPPAQMIRVVASRRKASRTQIQNAMQAVLRSAEMCTRVEDAFHRCDRSANSQGKNVLDPIGVFFLHCRVQQARRKFLRVVNLVCTARLEAFGNNKTQRLSSMHLCRSWRKTHLSPRKRREKRTKLRTLETKLSVMSYEPVLPHCAVIEPCVCLPAPAASPCRQKTTALCGPRDWPLLLLRSLPEENHG